MGKLRRILVVRPDRIGDVLLSTPVFHTLRDSFPGSFIGALVSPVTAPLLENNPNIDVILTDGTDEKNKEKSFWRKVKQIRSYRFDTALLLKPTERHAYMLFFAGIRHRIGVGHILYEVLTFMRGVSRKGYDPLRHESDYMLDLARKIGAKRIWSTPEIFLTKSEMIKARDLLLGLGFDLHQPIVNIHPGSGHSAPNWRTRRYVDLARQVANHGIQVLVTGNSSESIFESEFRDIPNTRTSFGQWNLRDLSAVISVASAFVSASTGPMHIAAAVGTPVVTMFCPLPACSPKLWGPIGSRTEIVLPPVDFCRAHCPGNPHVCTFGEGDDGIQVDMVFSALLRVLNEKEKANVN
jgi:lipopolysaccharide heptosyltransferase II